MIPTIDPSVRYVGSTFLRGMNVEAMRALAGAVVVQDAEAVPMVVILPYGTYLAMQEATVGKDGAQNFEAPAALVTAPVGVLIQCRHCGETGARGSSKHATICFGCKGGGHTGQPGECPRCGEYGTGGL